MNNTQKTYIRTHMSLTKRQTDLLAALCKATGLKKGEHVRRALDNYLAEHEYVYDTDGSADEEEKT